MRLDHPAAFPKCESLSPCPRRSGRPAAHAAPPGAALPPTREHPYRMTHTGLFTDVLHDESGGGAALCLLYSHDHEDLRRHGSCFPAQRRGTNGLLPCLQLEGKSGTPLHDRVLPQRAQGLAAGEPRPGGGRGDPRTGRNALDGIFPQQRAERILLRLRRRCGHGDDFHGDSFLGDRRLCGMGQHGDRRRIAGLSGTRTLGLRSLS